MSRWFRFVWLALRLQRAGRNRLAARVVDLARYGGYDARGVAGARRVEIRSDGEALCALRTGATGHGEGPTCYVFAMVDKRYAAQSAPASLDSA
jgi:hypothetical protein